MYKPSEIAIYIHWPFCKSKCPYCDFYKTLPININQEEIINEYIESLEKYYLLTVERSVKSVFFGGGTPSLIKAKNIEKIIDFISSRWLVNNNIEITLEANPNTHAQCLFTDLKKAGINRLSLGVQALNENDLHFLGRSHNLQIARQCLEEVVKIYDNQSADLIYARPEQNIAEWVRELEEISSYGLKHISLYQLTIEEGTVFARKNVQTLPEDKAIEMYNFTRDYLAEKNYRQYEVSNFAKKDFEAKHNLTYWQGGDYIGIGKSAHGRICINGKHIATEYPFKHSELTAEERAEELIIMGLRLNSGIDKQNFHTICGIAFDDFINKENLQKLKELKLVEDSTGNIRVTYDGMLLINHIVEELCS